MKIELIFAEIGDRAQKVDRAHFLKFFPDAHIRVITEGKCIGDRSHPRWGWRMNDYHKALGLLESNADIAIAFDADMRIVSDEVKTIMRLAEKFGMCFPANPRKMVKIDNEIGADAKIEIPEYTGLMHAVNCGIMAMYRADMVAPDCVRNFLEIMEKYPMRGPMAWAKAFCQTSFYPGLLPPQWCVCAEDIGIGNEIVLHVGHEKVREHYARIL